MIQRLQQQIARHRRLVGLLCLTVVLQTLWCCAWHIHTSPHVEAEAVGTTHLGHHESHADSPTDAVEVEPTAVLKFFSEGLGLIVVLSLLIALPMTQAIRAPLTTPALSSSRLRLRPPERAPPLA
ncbi:hypothetical protein LV476_05355 [Guyparkeria hydrothermalis]|uniref:hypothetical protein n=1 Tax=Guyparkeria hydrothermalis TaxID=923 RepID=UPI0020213301|nr:hypothetical protein [Guyparkeria hydrothermalis]MCL7744376.1 hypothetical protein [Guyparkeria hydrothermalis]